MNDERRPKPPPASAPNADPTVDPIGALERVVRVRVVVGVTPRGATRWRAYLSPTRAKDRALVWSRRGWAVAVLHGIVTPTVVDQYPPSPRRGAP